MLTKMLVIFFCFYQGGVNLVVVTCIQIMIFLLQSLKSRYVHSLKFFLSISIIEKFRKTLRISRRQVLVDSET